MEALKIKILNPKAKKIIQGLVDLKLIQITEERDSDQKFRLLLKKLRSYSAESPSLDEITKIVEEARTERYERKSTQGHS
ncbi:hypothetical protein [Sunxiuqinia dokdonensis]|uniref:Uncharacterized protein n=1 Tax=Sunxiuqinia dokdonensis TaxID=1409788 RepID=A0A0L8VDP8_9BACT|nr:hypothetical protein [Sunxiuqinia dokdonensis]KOH46287.1 hypothetical protein NC99_08970 [Sunxiuqinia dokdonensis]